MQKRMKKMTAAFCLETAVLALVPAPSMAEAAAIPVINQQESSIVPYMLYITYTRSNILVSGRTVTVDCRMTGEKSTVTKAKVVAELQEKNGSSWTTIATWTDTQNTYSASVYESKTVTAGKTYRVKTTVTAWAGTASETQTLYSEEKAV